MELYSGVLISAFILWSIFTLIVLIIVKDMYTLLRSVGFIVICLGYIIIIAIHPILKKLIGEEY